jgi:hypothetical protein
MDLRHQALHHALHKTKAHVALGGSALLTYYIFEGVLVGILDSRFVHLTAHSGGGGGSTKNLTTESANNPYLYGLKEVDIKFKDKSKNKHVHGGPIPPGTYTIETPSNHKKLGLSARLVPHHALPNDRGGFYIHGPGPHGSDGCIVVDRSDLHKFMHALTASKGGSLVVCQAMESAFA